MSHFSSTNHSIVIRKCGRSFREVYRIQSALISYGNNDFHHKIPRWTLRGGGPIRKPFELFRKRWLECPTALKCRNIVILWCCNITFSCHCMTLKVKDSKNVDNIGYSWWRTFSRFHNWPLETPYRIVLHQNNHWAIFKEFMIILII